MALYMAKLAMTVEQMGSYEIEADSIEEARKRFDNVYDKNDAAWFSPRLKNLEVISTGIRVDEEPKLSTQ